MLDGESAIKINSTVHNNMRRPKHQKTTQTAVAVLPTRHQSELCELAGQHFDKHTGEAIREAVSRGGKNLKINLKK